MAWSAVIAAGASLLGGVMGGKGKEEQDKANKAYESAENRALASDKAKYSAIDTLFENKVADHYSQLQRQRKQRGLDQFRSFSTMQRIQPGYSESGNGIELPREPTIGDYNNLIGQAGMSESPVKSGGGGSGGNSIMKTLDPVAVKLGLFK